MTQLSGKSPPITQIVPPGVEGCARIGAVDGLRGLAICGMVIYHIAWDLQVLGLSAVGPADILALRWLGNAVAAAFLLISGFGLTLAERADHSWSRKLGRLAVLALAAGAVTLVTWVISPDLAVRFGILHCLTLCNLIGVLLGRVPNVTLVLAGGLCMLLPLVWPWPLDPRWAWIGLSHEVPATLDFRPVLPWLAFVLFGMAAARSPLTPLLAAMSLGSLAGRGAAFAGRHSLAIYLTHQPALFAALMLVMAVTGESRTERPLIARADAAAFLNACTNACSSGQDATLCRATCHCLLTASAKPDNGLRGLLARVQGPGARLRQAAERCRPASAIDQAFVARPS